MSEDFVMKCPKCHLKTKYTIKHLGASRLCNANIDLNVFKDQFKTYKKEKEKKDNVIRQRIHIEKMMKLDEKKAKKVNATKQRIHR